MRNRDAGAGLTHRQPCLAAQFTVVKDTSKLLVEGAGSRVKGSFKKSQETTNVTALRVDTSPPPQRTQLQQHVLLTLINMFSLESASWVETSRADGISRQLLLKGRGRRLGPAPATLSCNHSTMALSWIQRGRHWLAKSLETLP